MILDLPRFIAEERPYWSELESVLAKLDADPHGARDLGFLTRFHLLYERASADLGKLATYASEPQMTLHLEALVARAYAEIHEERDRGAKFSPLRFLLGEFPRAVRRHTRALGLAVVLTLVGIAFGALVLALDPDSKRVLLPFSHLQGDPSARVHEEESGKGRHAEGSPYASFSSFLMTHNIRVAFFCFALGATWGLGTAVLLFYNGVILGAVALDYVRAGQTRFLLGWLLPHGSIEIPAFVLASQAGFVFAAALIGWGDRKGLGTRLADVLSDVVAILSGVAALLVWAGLVESYLSQQHEPVLPYALKIALGLLEASLLSVFLWPAGRRSEAV